MTGCRQHDNLARISVDSRLTAKPADLAYCRCANAVHTALHICPRGGQRVPLCAALRRETATIGLQRNLCLLLSRNKYGCPDAGVTWG